MDQKTKEIVGLWALLTLVVALSSVIVSVGSSPTTTYAVDPAIVTARAGETFTIDVRIYEAFYLYSWQVYMSWDTAVLEYSSCVYGGFLTDQPEGSSETTRIEETYCIFSEATLGSYMGKTAAEGLLVSVTFKVKAESTTTIAIDHPTQTLYVECFVPPQLIQVTDFNKINGEYFAPRVEDLNADGYINIFDISSVAIHWGETGTPGWILADLWGPLEEPDGVVDIYDLSKVAVVFGLHYAG